MFNATTHQITVSVLPVYIDEQSDPARSHYFWAYRVVISNESTQKVQLLSRYWKIIDAHGTIQEVEGEGVVGVQPVIEPGEEFTYTSGCPLNSTSGIMQGYYVMQLPDQTCLNVEIPAFPLDLPDSNPILN